MTTDTPTRLTTRVLARHLSTGSSLADVAIEVLDDTGEVVTASRTGPDGVAELALDAALAERSLRVRVAGLDGGAPLAGVALTGEQVLELDIPAADRVDPAALARLADHLVATRLVRADDLARDLAAPRADSVVRLMSPADRARLLADLTAALADESLEDPTGDRHLVDPVRLRDGELVLVRVDDLLDGIDLPELDGDLDRFTQPGLGWELLPWAKADDQSYRDHLRSVFVLFAHQQKLGFYADPTTFPDIVERQLERRFFQDFRTEDRTETPVNRLLVPIVTAILTSPTGDGFGFGLPAGSLPAQGDLTDRQHLDALLALTGEEVDELANRYRLPLTEPDTTLSSPVRLNVHTLSRILSDTAQGPVEPPENVIVPQLPGEEGKPILWPSVVGSAPFFLRFDEWLARQQPFFAENLFALRSQVVGVARGRPWLDADRKASLEYHRSRPVGWSMTPYTGYFGSIGEVQRSAQFLLDYGAADAKLVEVVQAIDKGQFAAALRLHGEAAGLLRAAAPQPVGSEDWEPETTAGFTFSRPLSLARRRRLKVSSITELTGTRRTYLPDGFERFFELATPGDINDVVSFRMARDQATRLRTYQERFLMPMLEAAIRTGLGDLPGAVSILGGVTGFHVGVGMLGTPAGMVKHPDAVAPAFRVVAGRLRWDDPLGDRPYTARLMYDDERHLDGPFPLTPQLRNDYDALTPEPPILHPLEERYARLVQADALLAWAETLYRTDDPAYLERARELYKAVVFLHGEDPGTSAYVPWSGTLQLPWFGLVENPRRRNQLDRARLALQQLAAGLNFYGYRDDAVPTLRYETLVSAAQRWTASARAAQADYLSYLGKVEQADLDVLSAKAQERKARATVAIAAEQVEIAKAGVVVAQRLVSAVEAQIAAKQQEIEDASSIFNQFKDYFSGMKSSISSLVDAGKSASEGYASLSSSSVGSALGLGEGSGAGAGAGAGSSSVGLGSAWGSLGVVGGYAAFVALSTSTLQGMADAATKRDGELKTLVNDALPAAKAAVRVQERQVAIAHLQGEIAATDLAYARDLVNYQNERFLNRDFWDALAGVAGRALHRYLDLAGQAAWFAERALAYQLAAPLRVIKLDYFDRRMRDVGGPDRLGLDLAELEAIRLGAARVTVPITRTYSLARDLPLAFGQLKRTGRCRFALTDDELIAGHPGTYAHRIRSVDVVVEAPGTNTAPRGILTNSGFSLLRPAPGATPVPLVRFADAYPVSEHRMAGRADAARSEQLLPFEGSGFTTSWALRLPEAANLASLDRVTDVRLTFELQAGYDPQQTSTATPPAAQVSRSMFVSALAVDPAGLATVHKQSTDQATLAFDLRRLPVPADATITNLAVLLPGVDKGNVVAELRVGSAGPTTFPIVGGVAMSNAGPLSSGGGAQQLNGALGVPLRQKLALTITKGNDAARLAQARDVLVWVEYAVG